MKIRRADTSPTSHKEDSFQLGCSMVNGAGFISAEGLKSVTGGCGLKQVLVALHKLEELVPAPRKRHIVFAQNFDAAMVSVHVALREWRGSALDPLVPTIRALGGTLNRNPQRPEDPSSPPYKVAAQSKNLKRGSAMIRDRGPDLNGHVSGVWARPYAIAPAETAADAGSAHECLVQVPK